MSASHGAQLFVADIVSNVDEEFLKQFFEECGQINSIILKKREGSDRQFCFLTYDKRESAYKALNDLNYSKISGLPIRISWAGLDTKKIFSSGKGNLFISGLDESIEVSQLHEAFANFGDIVSCKITMSKDKNDQWKSNGYGFIQYRYPEDAEKAVSDLSGATINQKKIIIEPFSKKPKKNLDEIFTNIYIKNILIKEIKDDKDLKHFCEQFGEVQSVKLTIIDQTTAFGLCNMTNHEDAIKAIQNINSLSKENGMIATRFMKKTERHRYLHERTVSFKKENHEKTKDRNLYFKNISLETTEDELKDFFSNFGEVENLLIAKEDQEPFLSKQFGFVLFKTNKDAHNAIVKSTFEPFKGKIIYLSFMKIKEERIKEKKTKPISKSPDTNLKINYQPFFSQTLPIYNPISPIYNSERRNLFNLIIENNPSLDVIKIEKVLKLSSDDQVSYLLTNKEMRDRWLEKIKDYNPESNKPKQSKKNNFEPIIQNPILNINEFPGLADQIPKQEVTKKWIENDHKTVHFEEIPYIPRSQQNNKQNSRPIEYNNKFNKSFKKKNNNKFKPYIFEEEDENKIEKIKKDEIKEKQLKFEQEKKRLQELEKIESLKKLEKQRLYEQNLSRELKKQNNNKSNFEDFRKKLNNERLKRKQEKIDRKKVYQIINNEILPKEEKLIENESIINSNKEIKTLLNKNNNIIQKSSKKTFWINLILISILIFIIYIIFFFNKK